MADRTFACVEARTCGKPVRVVTDGALSWEPSAPHIHPNSGLLYCIS